MHSHKQTLPTLERFNNLSDVGGNDIKSCICGENSDEDRELNGGKTSVGSFAIKSDQREEVRDSDYTQGVVTDSKLGHWYSQDRKKWCQTEGFG